MGSACGCAAKAAPTQRECGSAVAARPARRGCRGVVQRGEVRIEGDAEVAQQYRELGLLLRPELEAALSRVLGRSGAHLTMRGLRAARSGRAPQPGPRCRTWPSTSRTSAASWSRAPRRSISCSAVEQLREQLDRLDARLAQLEQRMQRLAGPPEPD